MIWPWRVDITYTIAFYIYQSTFLSKKLNVEEKLTGRPSPTVHWGDGTWSSQILSFNSTTLISITFMPQLTGCWGEILYSAWVIILNLQEPQKKANCFNFMLDPKGVILFVHKNPSALPNWPPLTQGLLCGAVDSLHVHVQRWSTLVTEDTCKQRYRLLTAPNEACFSLYELW